MGPTDTDADRDWVGRIEELQREDIIDADDEATLVRHVAERRAMLQEALANIEPEYRRRLGADGKASADEWLAGVARSLGEADGRASRDVVDGLDASRRT